MRPRFRTKAFRKNSTLRTEPLELLSRNSWTHHVERSFFQRPRRRAIQRNYFFVFEIFLQHVAMGAGDNPQGPRDTQQADVSPVMKRRIVWRSKQELYLLYLEGFGTTVGTSLHNSYCIRLGRGHHCQQENERHH